MLVEECTEAVGPREPQHNRGGVGQGAEAFLDFFTCFGAGGGGFGFEVRDPGAQLTQFLYNLPLISVQVHH